MKKAILITTAAVLIFFIIISCIPDTAPGHDNPADPENPDNLFTVTFNCGPGSSIESREDVLTGSTINAPSDPAWVYGTFLGWFKESELINQWAFSTDTVTSDITLYAGWDEYEVGDTGPAGGILFYDDTIGFNWDGADGIEADEKLLFSGTSLDGSRFLEVTDQLWGDHLAFASDGMKDWEDLPGTDNSSIPNMPDSVPSDAKNTVGDGWANTEAIHIMHEGWQPNSAGETAYWISIGDEDDWFLPSFGELYLLEEKVSIVPDIINLTIWSSSEFDDDEAWCYSYDNGEGVANLKDSTHYLRPIRAF